VISLNKHWRKSTFSGPGGECVEVAHNLGALRDSKNQATLSVDVPRVVTAIKEGRLTP
jgi:hypothetical protein